MSQESERKDQVEIDEKHDWITQFKTSAKPDSPFAFDIVDLSMNYQDILNSLTTQSCPITIEQWKLFQESAKEVHNQFESIKNNIKSQSLICQTIHQYQMDLQTNENTFDIKVLTKLLSRMYELSPEDRYLYELFSHWSTVAAAREEVWYDNIFWSRVFYNLFYRKSTKYSDIVLFVQSGDEASDAAQTAYATVIDSERIERIIAEASQPQSEHVQHQDLLKVQKMSTLALKSLSDMFVLDHQYVFSLVVTKLSYELHYYDCPWSVGYRCIRLTQTVLPNRFSSMNDIDQLINAGLDMLTLKEMTQQAASNIKTTSTSKHHIGH